MFHKCYSVDNIFLIGNNMTGYEKSPDYSSPGSNFAGFVLLLVCLIIAYYFFYHEKGDKKTEQIIWTVCQQGEVRNNCIVDGDTFWLQGEKYRLFSVDTPEKFLLSKCKIEHAKSLEATNFLVGIFTNSVLRHEKIGLDVYDRILVKTYADKKSVAKIIIESGLGVEYKSENRDRDIWCDDSGKVSNK